MSINVILLGFQPKVIKGLENTDVKLYIIAEKELYENKFQNYHSHIIEKVVFAGYQQSEECIDATLNLAKEVEFSAVIAGREYAVYNANLIAKKLNLPRLGDMAAEALTNKLKLRKLCEKIGIRQPKYQEINKESDLLDTSIINFPKILKPSNRQSSVGVIKVNKSNESLDAWRKSTSAKEEGILVTNRNFRWTYQAEELMEGYEVSCEVFVKDKEIVFENITEKLTTNSIYSVEVGHTLPAQIPGKVKKDIVSQKNKLVGGLDVSNGILHSEWMITSEGAKLIECAGRAPGDNIPILIEDAYNFKFYEQYLNILMISSKVTLPKEPGNVTGIRFFTPKPGKLIGISNEDYLKNSPSILKYEINRKNGELVNPLTSSWDRIGFYLFKVSNHQSMKELTKSVEKEVCFITK